MCELCQMYKKLHTADGTQLWIEYTKNAVPELVPVLVMDSTAFGGGRNELWMKFCPLCGRELVAFRHYEEQPMKRSNGEETES